jgi:surfeit locus 1 family protein
VTARRAIGLALLALAVASLCALGVWQLQRREWKHALIARVEQRVHASAIDVPASADDAEYLHVFAQGRYLPGRDTLVSASTDLGAGYWVLSPLARDGGGVVLINRGFVPSDQRAAPPPPPEGEQRAVGLLRRSEPHGRLFRANDPAEERWYSRDVAAIAAKRGLADVAPYFIDQEAQPGSPPWPRAGLTVLAFADNHLIYALTWFALAAMLIGFAARAIVWRDNEGQEHVAG